MFSLLFLLFISPVKAGDSLICPETRHLDGRPGADPAYPDCWTYNPDDPFLYYPVSHGTDDYYPSQKNTWSLACTFTFMPNRYEWECVLAIE